MTSSPKGTLDPKEVEKFEALARTWWDPQGPMRPLHQINPLRLDFIKEEACRHFQLNIKEDTPFSGLRAVDVGCAGGLVSEPLARWGAEVTGLDPASENVEVARLHAKKSGLSIAYKKQTLEELVAEGERFDILTALEVIEHVADIPVFVEACCSALKPEGILFLSTLNRTMRSFALAVVGAEYILHWLPKGTHDWQRFVKPEEIEDHLKENSFKFKRIEGVTFSPLFFRWNRSSDLSINYQLCAVKKNF